MDFKHIFLVLCALVLAMPVAAQKDKVKIAVIGLTHTHVHWIFGSEQQEGTFQIVGIVEPDRALARRYADEHGFSMKKVFNSADEMLVTVHPDAVCAFGTIYQHLEVVEKFAPLGIHVMVEKPLAVSLEHAQKMQALARQYNIHLLTNYETDWYPTNHKAYEMTQDGVIGDLVKVVVRDGHKGPKKIGINSEFLDWLTDPVQNGGGAITDFGCYGINLMTWLMNGEKPVSVTAVTQQLQPGNNPKVDDDATILLTYPKANATIQASWNWPIGRKDMEIYGRKGAILVDNRHDMRLRISEGYDGYQEEKYTLEERRPPYNDPFSMFAAVIKGEVKLPKYDMMSLENNMVVMQILDAARQSAGTQKTVMINE